MLPCLVPGRIVEKAAMNNRAPLKGFPDSWRAIFTEMQHEWKRLHGEIARLRRERDQLAKALLALLHEEVSVNEAEVLAQIGREKPLREFLQEMRTHVGEA
jgi:hypothetical protein